MNRLIEAFAALESEFVEALNKPKASRRPALGKEFMDNTAALVETLDKISTRVAAAVNHDDPVIDQMLMIKQLAWLMRNTAGEASLLVSNGLAAGNMTPDFRQNYIKLVGGIETAWAAVQTVAAATELPPGFIRRWRRPRRPISTRNFSASATADQCAGQRRKAGDEGQRMESRSRSSI